MPRRRLPRKCYRIAAQGYAFLGETWVLQDTVSFEIGIFEKWDA